MSEHILPEIAKRNRSSQASAATLAAVIATLISLTATAAAPCPPQMGTGDGASVVSSGDACPTPQLGLSDTPNYNDPMAACQRLDARRVVNVSNSAALQEALRNASCGETIQLASGTYNSTFSVDKSCPMSAPIVVKGAENFGSVITDEFTINGTRTIVMDIKFAGPNSGVRLAGTNNKLIANKFTDWRHVAVLTSAGKQGEIAYNEFSNPNPWLADESGYPLRIGIRSTEKDPSSFHYDAWVHHNYFHDFPAKPNPEQYNSGQSDAIEVCQSGRDSTALMRTGWYVESNLVQRHMQGHGVVDFKCGGNVVRFNTLVDSPGGRIDARGGSYSIFESNWIENSGGSSIHGGYNKIVGNYVRGGPINVMAGDLEWNTAGGGHPRAYATLLAGNDASAVNVGKANDGHASYPALETIVEGHVGPKPTLATEQDTTIRESTQARFSSAFRLSTGSVGPSALTGAPSSYLACRVP